mmetsp:Transcript_4493/g.7957  ORF Transcript_4493/g.7957 Transcript_4493/m.7957 type:complete len:228 (-) Transcript_4493:2062-2745(-)
MPCSPRREWASPSPTAFRAVASDSRRTCCDRCDRSVRAASDWPPARRKANSDGRCSVSCSCRSCSTRQCRSRIWESASAAGLGATSSRTSADARVPPNVAGTAAASPAARSSGSWEPSAGGRRGETGNGDPPALPPLSSSTSSNPMLGTPVASASAVALGKVDGWVAGAAGGAGGSCSRRTQRVWKAMSSDSDMMARFCSSSSKIWSRSFSYSSCSRGSSKTSSSKK